MRARPRPLRRGLGSKLSCGRSRASHHKLEAERAHPSSRLRLQPRLNGFMRQAGKRVAAHARQQCEIEWIRSG